MQNQSNDWQTNQSDNRVTDQNSLWSSLAESVEQPSEQPSNNPDYTARLAEVKPVAWTASESIIQKRSRGWYIIATAVVLAVIGLLIGLYFAKIFDLAPVIIASLLVLTMYAAVLVSAKLPAREISYILTGSELIINGNRQPLTDFRAFGVRQLDGVWQLILIPNKRFGVELSAFIDDEQGEQIVDILSARLPMEQIPSNLVDKLIRQLKL